jgi:hypothetical protein
MIWGGIITVTTHILHDESVDVVIVGKFHSLASPVVGCGSWYDCNQFAF